MDGREYEVSVTAKEVVADGVVVLVLQEAYGEVLPAWEPGAHIDLILENAPTRQYSLCGDPSDQQTYRLGILRDDGGRGSSKYIHDSVNVGDNLRIRGPRNHFQLVPSTDYLFIAGGIGVTPILPMIAHADEVGADWRLLYGGRKRSSMAFVDELAKYGDRVRVCPEDEVGSLDLANALAVVGDNTLIYCCGPEPLLLALEEQCGRALSKVLHIERFAPKDLTEPMLDGAFEVYLTQSDASMVIPPDRSIISVLDEAGIYVPSSCSEGTCGTCETPVLEGVPDHRDSILTPDERDANDCMMLCVSRSCTTRLVLDL
ncbi:PDR/VanB family oxidoreductase [Rhodococcus erythropolis]